MSILTPEQLSTRWGVSKGTLANWRMSKVKRGPKFIKNFGKVFYKSDDIEKFEKKNKIIKKPL